MKKSRFLICLIFVILFIPSCNKEKNEIKFYWKETWCSNPWNDNSNGIEDLVKEKVITYLESKKIKVTEVVIEFVEIEAELCKACNCLSGNTIIVTLDDKYANKIAKLGFEVYE